MNKFQTYLFDPLMGPLLLLTLLVRVDLGEMAMKEYSTLSSTPDLELRHRMQFRVILRTQ